MGKYAATRATQRNNPTWQSVRGSFLGNINSEEDYIFQSFLANVDPTGLYRGYLTSRDSTRYMRDYLDNRGLKWSDIKYPTRTMGFDSSGRFYSSALMVSANIAKLY